MRLIDADKLEEILNINLYDEEEAALLARMIDSVPTMDSEPTHSWWTVLTTSAYIGLDKYSEPKFADRRFYRCSKCGNSTVIKSNYCSCCGSKMDLGVFEI